MGDVLLVDWIAVLDGSGVGKKAAEELTSLWTAASGQTDAAKEQLHEQLQRRRDRLRDELVARAKPLLASLAKQKKAKLVLEKSQVAWADATVEDVTPALIAEVDRGGPLKA